MLRRSILIVAVLSIFLCSAMPALAGDSQSTFSISPPPIATPVFDVKETDLKVGLTYLSMKSKATGSTEFKLSGYGVDAVGRSAFGNVLALDYAIGILYLSGDFGGSGSGMKLSGASIPISINLEVQPYKNDVFNVIFFVGPAFNITEMSVKSNITIGGTTYSDTTDISSYMYGPQGGVQMGLLMGDVSEALRIRIPLISARTCTDPKAECRWGF